MPRLMLFLPLPASARQSECAAPFSAISALHPAATANASRHRGVNNRHTTHTSREVIMTRTRNIGILLFDDVEELDFVGPYEVFTMSNEMYGFKGEETRDNVFLIGETGQKITCAKAMVVEPHMSIADAPELDLLLVQIGRASCRGRVRMVGGA